MNYKQGDRVKIKSLNWYNDNKDADGFVHCGDRVFDDYMSAFCGRVVTISWVYPHNKYDIQEDTHYRTWTDEMIEGLVEEGTKSEPKFHIGDWVTDGIIKCQIHFIDNNQYWYSKFCILGNIESVDKRYHLYTIQDAKDGDVLAEDSCIFIIQKLGDNSTAAKTYCALHNDGDFENGSILYFDIDSTKPATEEEKQKLFKAIKDNGYEWNSETKTLEKLIEPKFREYSDNEPLDVPTMTTDFVKEHGFPCPEGYIFKDENGNVINATKIVLEKVNTLKTQSNNMETETHRGYCTTDVETTNESKKVAWFTFEDNDFADKVELALSNRELIQEDGKWFVVKKKKEYPKTYEECCEIVKVGKEHTLEGTTIRINYKIALLESFQKLLICRDAYWKIAGEEMGLGKSWKPDYSGTFEDGTPIKYVIYNIGTHIVKERKSSPNHIFSFPTPEMRDAFKENFDPYIEFCKELL